MVSYKVSTRVTTVAKRSALALNAEIPSKFRITNHHEVRMSLLRLPKQRPHRSSSHRPRSHAAIVRSATRFFEIAHHYRSNIWWSGVSLFSFGSILHCQRATNHHQTLPHRRTLMDQVRRSRVRHVRSRKEDERAPGHARFASRRHSASSSTS